MTLRSLEVFLAVVETGSMHGAAEQLYISPPSVSGVVTSLEQQYGVRLFERFGKKLHVTPEGEQMAEYARRLLNLSSELERQMGRAAAEAPLRVGATVTVGICLIGGILKSVKLEPSYVCIGNTGMIERKLLQNQLDVALVEGNIQSNDLLCTPVIPNRFVLACSRAHRFANRAYIRLAELDGEPLIMREKESGSWKTMEKAFQDASVPMRVVWECNNIQATLNAVRMGFGVTILSEHLLHGDTDLVAVPVEGLQSELWISLVVHKDKFLRPNLRMFIEQCKDSLQNRS